MTTPSRSTNPPPTPTHPAQSGETGHQGADRQPGKHIPDAHLPTPGPNQAATAGQTQSRSNGAINKQPVINSPDYVHPGPDRYELEKSKGNAHHDQHEPQPDMQDEFKDL